MVSLNWGGMASGYRYFITLFYFILLSRILGFYSSRTSGILISWFKSFLILFFMFRLDETKDSWRFIISFVTYLGAATT